MNYLNIAKQYREEAIKRLQELLRIKSVYDEKTIGEGAPFGKGIKDALDYFLNMAKQDGFSVVNDNGYAGCIEYGDNDEAIGVLCHLDVVPEGDNWWCDPYSATIKDNKIYARGSMDDKGPTIASYFALKILKDLNVKLNKKIQLILGTDEESEWRGIKHYALNYPMPEVGFAPDADYPLIYGEKGILRLDFTSTCQVPQMISFHGGERYNVVIDKANAILTLNLEKEFKQYLTTFKLDGDMNKVGDNYLYTIKGTSAHAMEPMKGVNAGEYLANFVTKYINHPVLDFINKFNHLDFHLNNIGAFYENEEMGKVTCNVGIIDIDQTKSRFTWDIRYPNHFDVEKLTTILKEVTPTYELDFTIIEHKTPHFVDPQDPLVQNLYDVYVKYTNDTVNKPYTIGGGTYARSLKKGVAFGMEKPNGLSLAHQPNEYIDIDELVLAIAIYAEAIEKLGQ